MDNLGRLYVPESNLLWMEVIQKHHDSLVARHPGYEKTLDLLQHNYYWPGMATTVKEYVTRCDTCQRFKGSNMAPVGFPHPLETLSLPWEHISADFITDLSCSHGFNAILTVVDWFSKEVELIPCTKKHVQPWIQPSYSCITCGSIMNSHIPSLQTEAHNLQHKSCRKLTKH